MKCYVIGRVSLYLLGLFIAAAVGAYITLLAIQTIGVSFIADWARFLTFLYGVLIAVMIQLITKAYSLGDLDGLKAAQHFKAAKIVKEKSRRLWALAGFYLFAAAASLLLPLAIKLDDAWAYYGAFVVSMALILSLYFAVRIPIWFEELRDFKWKVQGQMKLEQERERAVDDLREGAAKGFKSDDQLDSSKHVRH